jgi:hypothetical protein
MKLARHVVLVIVDKEAQRPFHVVLNELAETRFTTHDAFGSADDVVAVWQQTGVIGGRVGGHVENVPDIFGRRYRTPL